jgi:hypothetical protein
MILLDTLEKLDNFFWWDLFNKEMVKRIIKCGGVVYFDNNEWSIRFNENTPILCYVRKIFSN